MGPLGKVKRALGLRIAEDIEREFPAVGKLAYQGEWDRDRVGRLIATTIPDSNAEIDEWVETNFKRPPEAGPSLIDQIRDAAKFDRGTPLKTVLEYCLAELKR